MLDLVFIFPYDIYQTKMMICVKTTKLKTVKDLLPTFLMCEILILCKAFTTLLSTQVLVLELPKTGLKMCLLYCALKYFL
jgi:hypothetical protein